ncbi:uncharacterized protein LOC6552078 [Drosophila erecta]|uniref:GG22126 n=1 Tax=Drosophila erecta TaxID=7220 RepID=B3P3F6_DROER|nr:uncharacterized protein LOC6552078 [Drosophila erecta]EDV48736.1 uncharacterized protein Dere_GG22126 [Drosophila erecta]
MQVHRFLCGILLYFSLLGVFSQDVSNVPTEPTASPIADKEAPKNTKPEASGSSKCKSNEILSENGCVNRDNFLNKIILSSWKDAGFGKAKARAGLVDVMQCKEDEVRTLFGCSKLPFPPHRDSNRVPMHHSRLDGARIVHDKGIFKLYHHVDDSERKPIRKPRESGPPITGHNRPRKYVFLPGRSIRKGHKCRANEVLGRRSRCIQRKRSVGQTQHQTNENERRK